MTRNIFYQKRVAMNVIKAVRLVIVVIVSGYFLTFLAGLFFTAGPTTQWSTTYIQILDINETEYQKIQKEIKHYAEQTLLGSCREIEGFNKKLSCNFGDKKGSIFIKDELLTLEGKQVISVNIGYSESKVSMYPSDILMTEEHQEKQKHILKIASDYKKRYKNVKVVFEYSPGNKKTLEIESLPYTVLPKFN